jgi:hypothetical protein
MSIAGAGGLLAGVGLITGAVPIHRIGRRTRPLAPLEMQIVAPREGVFDVIMAPYADRKT